MVHMVVLRGICGNELGIEPSKVTTRQIAGRLLSEIKDNCSALASLAARGTFLARAVLAVPNSIIFMRVVKNINCTTPCFTEPKHELSFYNISDGLLDIARSALEEQIVVRPMKFTARTLKKHFSCCKNINEFNIEYYARGALKTVQLVFYPPPVKAFIIADALGKYQII